MYIIIKDNNGKEIKIDNLNDTKFIILGTDKGAVLLGSSNYSDLMNILSNIVLSSYNVGTELIYGYQKEFNLKKNLPTLLDFLYELNTTVCFLDKINTIDKNITDNSQLIFKDKDGTVYNINLKEYLIEGIKDKFNELFNDDEEEN